ncbi:MAG: O-antigen ligase family protein [Clostridia bacterium]|nr:O-antigen ligase family protein [Clostridia bacterium]
MKQQCSMISALYILSILVFEVFYVDNAYFNIMEAKAMMLRIITAAFIVLFLVMILTFAFRENAAKSLKKKISQLDIVDYAVIIFAAVSVISCIFSDYPSEAMSGSRGWGGGAWMYVCLALLYFFVSRSIKVGRGFFLTMLVSGSVIFLWSILNMCSVDLFGMHEGIYGGKSAALCYLSSIGNSNSMAGYASMLTAAAGVLFVAAEKKSSRIAYGVFLFLGYTCCVVANCDGVYLGLAAAAFCMTFYAVGSMKRIRALVMEGVIFSAAVCFVRLLRLVSTREKFFDLTGVSAYICEGNLFVAILFVFLAAYIAISIVKLPDISRFAKWIRVGTAAVFVIAAVGAALYAARDFGDEWGSFRGYIWRRSAEMFSELDIKGKIFGVGPDCFGILFASDPKATLPGAIVLNAHNEWLQYLITTGIVGTAAYAFMWAAPACDALFIRKKMSAPRAAVLAAVAAYAAQAVVNNPQPLCMSVLFLFLSMYRAGGELFEMDRSVLDVFGRETVGTVEK